MAELTNERLTELIRYLGCTSMEHGDGIYRALTELLERRKAEECAHAAYATASAKFHGEFSCPE